MLLPSCTPKPRLAPPAAHIRRTHEWLLLPVKRTMLSIVFGPTNTAFGLVVVDGSID